MTDRAALRIAPAPMLLAVLALLLAACGSDRSDGELMRRVAEAEAAAVRAEVAQGKAERAAASANNATIAEEAGVSDEMDEPIGDEGIDFDPEGAAFDNEIVSAPAAPAPPNV